MILILSIQHKTNRWIGGSANRMVRAKNWRDFSPEWRPRENNIIEHMNKDHKDSIQSTLHGIHKIKDKNDRNGKININMDDDVIRGSTVV